jgi:glutathione S-transferase
MPTLYYSPETRATRVIAQLIDMGKLAEVDVINVSIIKSDGSGQRDPNNPHPEGKVPYLVTDDGEHIRESAAIMMYLDEIFGSHFSIPAGQKGRGEFLSWMMYYGGVLEPAMVAHFAEIDHPAMKNCFRTMKEVGDHIATGLGDKLFLLGDKITLADMIVGSSFHWAPHLTPDFDTVKAWLKRVADAQDGAAVMVYETKAKAALSQRA